METVVVVGVRGPNQKMPMLLGRFTTTTPLALFRIQSATSVRLHLEAAARAAGRTSFDIAERDGAVWPRAADEPNFLGPNGMSMRPSGHMLAVIVGTFKAKGARVFEVPAGAHVPPALVVLHEHSDHYSVQPAERMTAARLNKELTAFLAQPGVRLHATLADFYAAHPDLHPTVVGFSKNA
jgi:hypothetical protein